MYQLGINGQQAAEALVVEQDIPAGFGLALADEQGLRCGVWFGVELNIQPPTMRLAFGEFLHSGNPGVPGGTPSRPELEGVVPNEPSS